MDPIEQENALLEQRIAELEAAMLAPEQESYGLGQLALDVPAGVAKATAGLADLGLMAFGQYRPSYQPSQRERVAQSTAQLAETLGLQPDTEVQKAVEFMTPLPGGTKARLAGDVLLGALAYGGSTLGEQIAPESNAAQIAGALGLPLAGVAGASAARGLTSALTPSAKVLLGTEAGLRAAAQKEVLRELGDEGLARLAVAQQMPDLATGTGGVPLTLAEIAQTPSAAKYQQAILATQGGGNILQEALNARQREIAAGIERLGITPEAGELPMALRDVAAAAAEQKLAQQEGLLSALGATPEQLRVSPLERATNLRESIGSAYEDAQTAARLKWEAVPKKTKLDVSGALQQTADEYKNYGKLAKESITGSAQSVIDEVDNILARKGIATVGELQDIRSAAGRAMAEASGKNPTQVSLMAALRDNIDNFGISYAYDPNVGIKGGLPGPTADLEALTKLSSAIEATRGVKQTFEQGVVGKLTAIRQFKPKLETSKVLNKVLETPENVAELEAKFGRNSTEMTQIRMQLLSDLADRKNPTEYIGRKRDVFQAAFKDDYKQVVDYAQKVGQKAPLSEYANITESVVPTRVFADLESTTKFAETFKGTPILEMGKAKFISSKLTKSGDPLANLQANKKVAQKLFGADYDALEKVLKDSEVAKSPARLQKQAASGNSITSINQTALGAIQSGRALIKLMKAGKLTGAITSGIPGFIAGAAVEKLATARETALDAFAAELLANPSLINLAAAPATKANIERLLTEGSKLGYLTKEEFIQQQPYIHGTTGKGASKIRKAGAFIPKTMRYSVLGEGTIYAAPKQSWWFDPKKAAERRMWELPKQVPVYVKPEANIVKITNQKDWENLAKRVNMQPDELADRLFYDPTASGAKWQKRRSALTKQKLQVAGVDAIEIADSKRLAYLQKPILKLQRAYTTLYHKIKKPNAPSFAEAKGPITVPYDILQRVYDKVTFPAGVFGDEQLAIINPSMAEPADKAYERLLRTNPEALKKITPEEIEMLSPSTQRRLVESGVTVKRQVDQSLDEENKQLEAQIRQIEQQLSNK